MDAAFRSLSQQGKGNLFMDAGNMLEIFALESMRAYNQPLFPKPRVWRDGTVCLPPSPLAGEGLGMRGN